MKIKRLIGKVFSRVHRILLNIRFYRKITVLLGLDSLNYKRYYKHLNYKSTEGVSYSDVDGYKDEGDFKKIVRLMELLSQSIPKPKAILDIGCGTGRYIKQMGEVWPDAHREGIDISKEIVEKFTRKQVPGVPVHILDIESDNTFHLEKQGRFDLVCLIGIIQILSLKKIHCILDKIHVLCEEGGYLYIQFNVETPDKKSFIGYKRYSIEELEGLLTSHGFVMVRGDRTEILKDYAYIIAQKSENHASSGDAIL